MSNYKGTPFPPIEAQVDMMRSHSIRPAARSPKRDTDQHTFILADPPSWSVGVPCIGDFARFDDPTGLKAGEAAARCAGCPVIEECLSAAMEEEQGLSAGSRYTIRGGLSPKERAALEFAARTCERGHRDRWGENHDKAVCLECLAEDKRRWYTDKAAADPEYLTRRAAALRERRRTHRVSCLECKMEMRTERFELHLERRHSDEERAA